MRSQDLRALRARAYATRRPATPWLLIAFDWVLGQVARAPRPVRMPLLYMVLILSETLLPMRLLLLQEALYDRLYPESARS